jgi:hypothetical protein
VLPLNIIIWNRTFTGGVALILQIFPLIVDETGKNPAHIRRTVKEVSTFAIASSFSACLERASRYSDHVHKTTSILPGGMINFFDKQLECDFLGRRTFPLCKNNSCEHTDIQRGASGTRISVQTSPRATDHQKVQSGVTLQPGILEI